MNYRKTLTRINLIAWSAIAVVFFLCSIALNNAQAKFLFETRIDYEGGDYAGSVAIGDLNGDSNLDIAAPNGLGENVMVLLGNGDGSFQSTMYYDIGHSPAFVAIGDFNGDTYQDLVVTIPDTDNVLVLLGKGDGNFQSAVNYATGKGPISVAIGNLNGDGHLDLAVANAGSNNVSVLLGNGDGSFQGAVNYEADEKPSSVAIGDLNGDGDLDLAVANGLDWNSDEVPGTVSVLLGNGDGSFQSTVNYGAGDGSSSVAIGDLNGDGDLDLAVSNMWSNNVSVLLGNGDGSFQPAVNYDPGGRSVAIGDLDGDGDLDLVTAGVSVLLGNGDGSFQKAMHYVAGDNYSYVAIGELNGDGALDLVTTFISVLLGNDDGTFPSAVNYGAGQWPSSVAIGNLNGDTNMELAVANKDSNNISVLLGNGDGSFQSAINYDADDGPNSVAIGDLNGDGAQDLAVANGYTCGSPMWGCGPYTVSVLLGNGDGSFQPAVNYATGYGPGYVAIGDLNGDSHLDLAVGYEGGYNPEIYGWYGSVWVLLGNGDGSFQSAVKYDDEGGSVAIGDLNGDGVLDLAVSNMWSNNVSVLLGNGDGSFQSAVNYGTAVDGPKSVAIGDLNGDGALDLAVAGGHDVSVLLSNGDGTFQGAVKYGAGNGITSVAIGDLSGDAKPDLAVANAHWNDVSVLLGNGDGSFQRAVNYGTAGDGIESVAIGDLNGDGDLDLAVSNRYSSNVSILINTGGVANLLYNSATPCRIVDTRKSEGIIGANTKRDFHVYGDGATIVAQGGNPAGCPSPAGEPLAAHINMIAVTPTGKGNLQAFPLGAGTGAGLSVNYNAIDTNLANAGIIKTVTSAGPDITVASNFSAAHTVIDVLGYYYPDEGFYYTPVDPCRIVDTRKTSAGIIDASTQRDFRVSGPVGDQGGDPAGCPTTLGVSPEAAHLNMIAVDPTGKGNLQAFPVGAGTGAGLSVNYNTIDTNLANAGTVKTSPDITVASNFSSAHTVIDVLGYYSEEVDLIYTPVTPCRIVDTRKTSASMIDASTQRNFNVYGSGATISAQGGDPDGCPSPLDEPHAVHINMVAVNPTGKGNLQAYPVGVGPGSGLSVNYNAIDTNLANAGTVKTNISGSVKDITLTSRFSSAHAVIDVLGYYYPAP